MVKKSFPRSSRIADLIKEEVAHLIMNVVNDPRVKHVTITQVNVTNDIKHTKIFFVTQAGKNKIEATQGLISAKGFIKKNLASIMKIRKMPELEFLYDEVFENGLHMESVLKKIKTEEG